MVRRENRHGLDNLRMPVEMGVSSFVGRGRRVEEMRREVGR